MNQTSPVIVVVAPAAYSVGRAPMHEHAVESSEESRVDRRLAASAVSLADVPLRRLRRSTAVEDDT